MKELFLFIKNHPLTRNSLFFSICRVIYWQIVSRIKKKITWKFVNNTFLIISRGMTGATGNVYVGLHEFNDMSFAIHFLRSSDLFLDVGANIGSYTVLASGVAGSKTISFEPVYKTVKALEANIEINNLSEKVKVYNCALGSTVGTLKFTSELDTINHVAADEKDVKLIEVPVLTVDTVLAKECPQLIKIDVEGFETEVIKGANETLKNSSLKAIIIELNGSGNRYGFNELLIHKILLGFGFHPFNYDPFERKLVEVQVSGTHNTIYIRDIDFVEKRLRTAAHFEVFNRFI